MELIFIKSILESEKIPFFVHNDHYGSLKIGPRIGLLNAKTIFVAESSAGRAKELISEYLKNTHDKTTELNGAKSTYSVADKIRVVIESLIFFWFIPGKRWHKKPKQN